MKKKEVKKVVKKVVKARSCKEGMDVFILLDRSGSMQCMWEEAISSINAYVKTLAKDKAPDRITVATFDATNSFSTTNSTTTTWTKYTNTSGTANLKYYPTTYECSSGNSFDILRDSVPIEAWENIKHCEIAPRGGTPLYDSFARLVEKAECVGNKKTAIVVVTDGEENASLVHNHTSIREIVKRIEVRGWQLNFLGANFDNFCQTSIIGVNSTYTIAYASGSSVDAMCYTASLASDYRNTGKTCGYTSNMRSVVGEDKVKK